MTEGDKWRSVVATVHIEKLYYPPAFKEYNGVVYWCGMRSPRNHHRVTETLDLGGDTRDCDRCMANRAKALKPKPDNPPM